MIINNRNIQVFEDKKHMVDFAVVLWKKIAFQTLSKKHFFTVALSGGKTPIPFYQSLAQYKEDLPWDKTHIFLVDERFVPFAHEDSNYRLMQDNLFKSINLKASNVHAVPTESKTASMAAENYEESLIDFFKLKQREFPVFDLMILGVGQDGHTASLFPNDLTLIEKEHLAVAAKSSTAKHDRITLTLPVINRAKNIMFLVSGKEKAEVFRKIVQKEDQNFPASLVRHEIGRTVFVVDKSVVATLACSLKEGCVDSM